MPTVICGGRRSLMATVVKRASRTSVALLEETVDSALSASVREQNQGSRAGSRPQQGEWQFPAARLISQHARDGTGGDKARRYSCDRFAGGRSAKRARSGPCRGRE